MTPHRSEDASRSGRMTKRRDKRRTTTSILAGSSKTYQNKLNSQSYRRLKIPTMTGRPRQYRKSVEVRSVLGELEATSKAESGSGGAGQAFCWWSVVWE
jgi:hypothetical protein